MPGVGISGLLEGTRQTWTLFAAVHQSHHALVASATSTPHFIIDPVNLDDEYSRRVFLLDHARAHQLINLFFGTAGPDLSEVDFDDPQDLRAWVDLNYTDHSVWQGLLPPS
jgi:hypothetical protein